MGNFADGKVYEKLGIRPMINAMGNATVLGGSTPSDMIKQAMEEASKILPEIALCEDAYAACDGAEALVIVTEGCWEARESERESQVKMQEQRDIDYTSQQLKCIPGAGRPACPN